MGHPPLHAAVLIIGSLLWETSDPIRRQWQEKNLNAQAKIPVQLPIRYGRLSDKRNTYTMVFSANAVATPGTGYVVPFNYSIQTLDQIHQQVRQLLIAENSPNDPDPSYDLSFCVAAFLIHPKYQVTSHPLISQILPHWRNSLGKRFNPDHYHTLGESAIVNDNAVLQFQWPDALAPFDFVIATATKPKPRNRAYPLPEEIAALVTTQPNDYFMNNRASGITTFQDAEISKYVKNSGK